MRWFSNLTVGKKLWLFAGFFITILTSLSILSYQGMKEIGLKLEDIGLVQLPAVSLMGAIDMYHDGTTGVVLGGFYSFDESGRDGVSASLNDLKENEIKFSELFEGLNKLPLREDTFLKIKAAKPEVDHYIELARLSLELLSQGKTLEAKEKLVEFKNQFEVLEEKLGALGEAIEADSSQSLAQGIEIEHQSLKLNLLLSFSGIFLCLVLAWGTIKGLKSSLETIYSQLQRDALELQKVSQLIGKGSTKLGESSEEQASAIQETASTLDEITSMISRGGENVEKAVALGNRSSQKAQEGGRAVQQMLGAISNIREANVGIMNQVEESNKKVGEIVDVINLITEKTKVINDIVFQTKLLSFNASVEAARAGEHGKGFAVVAEEVGNLAQSSGKASQEISRILDESLNKVRGIIQDGQEKVSTLIEEGRGKIESGVEVAQKCEVVLGDVLQDVQSMGHMISEINEFAREQSSGVQNISAAVNQLDKSAQVNASLGRELLSSSESLIEQGENLEQAVMNLQAQIYGPGKFEGSGSKTPNLAPIQDISASRHKENGEFKKAA